MNSLISIIVPVYNVEKYLKKCVDSIVNQTYKNIEVLLIDDGSTDNSGKLCDDIGKSDRRISVYHKENGGLSSARNYGIDRAKGEYIGFVDSDDYVDKEMYSYLYHLIKDNDADLSMCRNADVYNERVFNDNKKKEVFIVDREKAIDYVLKAEIASVSAVNKLYSRSIFDSIRYPENKTLEDAFVIVEILDKCEKIVIGTEQKYYYVHRSDSITTERFSRKNLDAIEAYEKNYKIIKEKYPAIIDTAKMRLCWAYFYVMDRIIYDYSADNKEIKKDTINYLSKNLPFILKNEQFSKGRKLSAILLKINPELYKMCVSLQNKRRIAH